MLEVHRVQVSYDGSAVLRNVSLAVARRQVVCLMGRNGVGKTTTLKTIAGLLKPQTGAVVLEGNEIQSLRPEQRARLGIAYVPQGREIFPNLTVWENLKISMLLHGGADDQAERAFALFPALKDMLSRKGGNLSGGQQQQLAIGRALLMNPKILLLDEPTEGIQPSIIDQIADTIQTIKTQTDISILLVEQYLDFALSVADRFYIMDRGSVVDEGPIANLNEEAVRQHLTV